MLRIKTGLKLVWAKSKIVLWTLFSLILFSLPDELMWEPFSGGDTYPWYQTALACLVLLAVVAYGYRQAKRWKLLHLDRSLLTWKSLAIVILGYLALYILDEIGMVWLEAIGKETTANELLLEEVFSRQPRLFVYLSVALLPAVLEELVFRGLLMKRFFGHFSWLGLVVSSLLFGWMHIPNDLPSWFIYAGAGLIFGYTYMKTDNLAYPIAIHFVNNFLAVFFD